MIDEDPVDLAALDPTQPPAAFATRLASVHRAAAHALARRRSPVNALGVVARWRVPLLAALLLVMLCSIALVRAVQTETGLEVDATDELAAVFGASTTTDDDSVLTPDASSIDVLLGGYEQ